MDQPLLILNLKIMQLLAELLLSSVKCECHFIVATCADLIKELNQSQYWLALLNFDLKKTTHLPSRSSIKCFQACTALSQPMPGDF